MSNKKQNTVEEVDIFEAIKKWVVGIDNTLTQMKQPVNENNPETLNKLRLGLKGLLNEAIVGIQKNLALNNTEGDAGLITSDPIGFTKAKTSYSSPKFLKTNKHGAAVDELCREILDEQAKAAIQQGMPVSTEQILNAQEDANDDTKKEISLKSADGNTELQINKETGDTKVLEKDKETGEMKEVGFFARHWQNVKDFCVNVWKWCKEKCTNFFNWVKSFFTEPDQADVITKAAA